MGFIQFQHDEGYRKEWWLLDEDQQTYWLSQEDEDLFLVKPSSSQSIDLPAWALLQPNTQIDFGGNNWQVTEKRILDFYGYNGSLPIEPSEKTQLKYSYLTNSEAESLILIYSGTEIVARQGWWLDPLEVLASQQSSLRGNVYRSKTLVCNYCGTAMDVKDEFRALYTFGNVEKPSSNLRIGMQGEIQGGNFTITGYIAYETTSGEWLEYQLYSPTYGYALIVIKDGEYFFLRKTFYLPTPNLWLLKTGDSFFAEEKKYQIEQFYQTSILYAAGDLPVVVHKNKRGKQCFAQAGDLCYHSKHSLKRVSYFRGYSMNKDELESGFR
ncbi:hypothetical protein GQR58_003312 [Nymphon striatum]|nr:hypothetical protein GQR58_003312 [Nymphon striatum]